LRVFAQGGKKKERRDSLREWAEPEREKKELRERHERLQPAGNAKSLIWAEGEGRVGCREKGCGESSSEKGWGVALYSTEKTQGKGAEKERGRDRIIASRQEKKKRKKKGKRSKERDGRLSKCSYPAHDQKERGGGGFSVGKEK